MAISLQDVLTTFSLSSLVEVQSPDVFLTSEASIVEDFPPLPTLLFEADKSLFDLALANGFRRIGAE